MRNVLATIVGFIVASAVVYIFETLIGQSLFPLPEGSDPTNMEWIKNNMYLIPTGAKIFVVIAHFMGIACGMLIARLISKTSIVPAYIVGALMIAATAFNLIMLPKEMWFSISDALFAIIGFLVGKKIAQSKITV